MLFRVRRPDPPRCPLGTFGISEAEYERIVARIREERTFSAFSRVASGKSPIAATTYWRDSTAISEGIRS